ncbi:FAD-dependent 5-carboxymethylaminomethyl-2-thiouridine(34) oxidoreductase MnmC [Oryzisolibacter sp. LB2S]|uniref:FAD-dependent 5-carboxymethylaminomethyl-2-thiouridine(34) oxidoreductase MnmC n=1 Tax=Alicycliphilus soli TaxID=3228789 RepID=UPI0034589668
MSDSVSWLPDGTPFCNRFGDRYHGEQGLAQARDVFLKGCGLPEAWAGAQQWRILETGFGFGLNFLTTWAAWRADPQRPRLLHFVSLEAWPVTGDDLLQAARRFPELLPLAQQLHAQYWGLLPGVHRLWFEDGRVLLTLCVGDAQTQLRQQLWEVDSVFLDGFAPERNPEIWSLETLKAMARHCRRGTRLATWSVARGVRNALTQCGFEVSKVPGLPPKRDNLRASFDPRWEPRSSRQPAAFTQPARCLVLGAGLAGATAAASLARRGWQVTVLDAAATPAAGASGLPAGLFAPHLSPDDNLFARVSRAGVRAMLQQSAALLQQGVDWNPAGVLERRPAGQLGLPADWQDGPGSDWSMPADAEHLAAAGLPADASACWHARAGWVRPARFIARLLAQPGITWRPHSAVARLVPTSGGPWQALDEAGTALTEAELVILATGPASNALLAPLGAAPLPLQPVRGQMSWGLQPPHADGLPPFAVNGGGALAAHVPCEGGLAWHMGATFERDMDRLPLTADEQAAAHAHNWQRLKALVPQAAEALRPAFEAGGDLRAWAGVRCTAHDRMPIVGPVAPAALPGLWISTAMGARGLTRAVLCAELLAARLMGEPLPVEAKLAQAMGCERL